MRCADGSAVRVCDAGRKHHNAANQDFPAMGEHWIQIGLLFGGRRDPTRPELLTYVTVEGRPRLTGVAYAAALLPGESPPAGPGLVWHDHVGTIDVESLIPHDGHAGHEVADRDPSRLEASQLARLSAVWDHLWKDLDRVLPVPARARLQAVR
jgi:hypothetical protein